MPIFAQPKNRFRKIQAPFVFAHVKNSSISFCDIVSYLFLYKKCLPWVDFCLRLQQFHIQLGLHCNSLAKSKAVFISFVSKQYIREQLLFCFVFCVKLSLSLFNHSKYCCDTREDLAKLPTGDGAGSTCIVIEDSSVHMLNSEGQWKEI